MEQPREGIPGLQPGQLIRLLKVCYGLSDGPLAWFKHLHRVLVEKLHYKQSLADPCIFYRHNQKTKSLSGIIGVATDDLLHGGDQEHQECMKYLQQNYKLGKFHFGDGRFTGKNFVTNKDGSVTIHQDHYTREKLSMIELSRLRKRQRFSNCTTEEISNLRASVGALSWLSKETRPDLAGRVAMLQQSFPECKVKDLIEANAITKEAHKTPESGIRIMPIPTENLRVGVATDASWGNARDLSQENHRRLLGGNRDQLDQTPCYSEKDVLSSGNEPWTRPSSDFTATADQGRPPRPDYQRHLDHA